MKIHVIALLSLLCALSAHAQRDINFNRGWQLHYPASSRLHPGEVKAVTLPRAWNEDEAFRVGIASLPDDTCRYTKTFAAPETWRGKHVFIEFEGARQAAEVWLNGHHVGLHQNGVMAFGFELTPYIRYGEENHIEVLTDNSWAYKERGVEPGPDDVAVKDGNSLPNNTLEPCSFQWNNKNFNMNMGGLPKNVKLHVVGDVYQTLPLYSNLGTTGVYVYGTDYDIGRRHVTAHVESQVINSSSMPRKVALRVEIFDIAGRKVAGFSGKPHQAMPGDTITLDASRTLSNVHFWSWGYGYLYTVMTSLTGDGVSDEAPVRLRTGFRKTYFGQGKILLNDRCIMVHGYAQRTSNEWPSVGTDVPAWMSDYSNGLMVRSGGNLVRWMHVTPSKQDVESCDRVGLMQAMPAGDAEKDVAGRHWRQRAELMRDAIIYNRNNPSIIFYECGNESISREHMLEMREIRDKYDFYGGRAIGSREMLDIRESEYGGEMLYINKSAHSPFWAMEYCRDEGLRKYWDDYSYPFHKEGEGNKGFHSAMANKMVAGDASPYNHNQDQFTVELVRRWYDYWRERAGSGQRISSGGVKIIFSDSNTHFRGVENYRRSGVTDALRIPKDGFFAHQVMWDGWVDVENPRIYIVGHWNYDKGTVKPVYVVSNTESVKLFLNGKEIQDLKRDYEFLFTAENVTFEPGKIEAVGYNGGKEAARYAIETAGQPTAIKLSRIENPSGWKADGADVALVQIEVVDAQGRRCPLANDMIHYDLEGPAEWRGGMAQGPDNYILAQDFPVECGVNRAIIRSTTTPGKVTLKASAEGLKGAEISLETIPFEVTGGLSTYIPGDHLKGRLDRGETPQTPSYYDRCVDVEIVSATAGVNADKANASFDDNELSEWTNDGRLSTAWITYRLGRMAQIDEVCVKFTGWRMRSYPIEIYAGDELIWEGETPRSLGYVHLPVKPVMTREITVKLKGSAQDEDAFGGIVEVVAPAAGELDLFKAKGAEKKSNELRIVEIEFKENLLQ